MIRACVLKRFEHKRSSLVCTQGSPNLANPGKETYRRALSVTSTRTGLNDGVEYLYTLNLACPQDLWDDLQPVFKQVNPNLLPTGLSFGRILLLLNADDYNLWCNPSYTAWGKS